jgi:hypothetical protein
MTATAESATDRLRNRVSLVVVIASSLVGAALALLTIGGVALVPLRGPVSMDAIFVPLVVVIGFVAAWLGYRFTALSQQATGLTGILGRHLFSRTVIAFAVAIVAFIGARVFFFALDNAFIGGSVQSWLVVIMAGVAGALWALIVLSWAYELDLVSILQLGLLALYGGMFSSMLIVEDKAWYTESVSFLGGDANTDMLFNLSVVTAGLVVFILGLELPRRLQRLVDDGTMNAWQLAIFQTLLIVISLGIMAVGFFPWGLKPGFGLTHDLGSHSMLLIFIVLMFFVRRLIPILDDRFMQTSRIFGVLALGVAAGLVSGQMYFAVAELLWFILLGGWLYLFLRAALRALEAHPTVSETAPVAMPRNARLLTVIVPGILVVGMALVSIAGLVSSQPA